MASAVSLRADYSAAELRRLAAASRHANQSRRLLFVDNSADSGAPDGDLWVEQRRFRGRGACLAAGPGCSCGIRPSAAPRASLAKRGTDASARIASQSRSRLGRPGESRMRKRRWRLPPRRCPCSSEEVRLRTGRSSRTKLSSHRVEKDARIADVERPVLPFSHLLKDGVGDGRD